MNSPDVRFVEVSPDDQTNSVTWDSSTRWYAVPDGQSGAGFTVAPEECTALASFVGLGLADELKPSADMNFVSSVSALTNIHGSGQLRIYEIDNAAHAQQLDNVLNQRSKTCSTFSIADRGLSPSKDALQLHDVPGASGVEELHFTHKSGYSGDFTWPVFLMHKGSLVLSLNLHDPNHQDVSQLSKIATDLSAGLDGLPQ